MDRPSYLNFDNKNYPWKSDIDYSKEQEKYKVGKGEQGVLICEPYKSIIVPYWKFKNRDLAQKSSEKIYSMFLNFIKQNDFVGADMARKFLQMGFTRARRYANYKGGRKYDKKDYSILTKGTGDPEKAVSAHIFFDKWQEAENNSEYAALKKSWREKYG